MVEPLLIAWHFAKTRWFSNVRDRGQLLALQDEKLRRFLAKVVKECPFYQSAGPALRDFPVMNKAGFLKNFRGLNRHAIRLDEATEVALRAEGNRDFSPLLRHGMSVGLSSGTSGERHVFLVSRADRCRWAGQMLARMLSGDLLRRVIHPLAPPVRIALFLRASSNLYTTISGWRVKLDYHDLTRPLEALHADLVRQPPDVLVAPASVLVELAHRESASRTALNPSQVISVAEVLDEHDSRRIGEIFGLRVAQIYQAAEGFLGATCREGRLHLNEETLHIEPRWMDDKRDRFQPIITDWCRTGQWFIRHQLNDILKVDDRPCGCGRASLTLRSIDGRAEEVLWARNRDGVACPVFPDVLRQAIYTMAEPPELYRLEQHGERWEIRIRNGNRELEIAVGNALTGLLHKLELGCPGLVFLPWLDQPAAEKQKRIRCVERPL